MYTRSRIHAHRQLILLPSRRKIFSPSFDYAPRQTQVRFWGILFNKSLFADALVIHTAKCINRATTPGNFASLFHRLIELRPLQLIGYNYCWMSFATLCHLNYMSRLRDMCAHSLTVRHVSFQQRSVCFCRGTYLATLKSLSVRDVRLNAMIHAITKCHSWEICIFIF